MASYKPIGLKAGSPTELDAAELDGDVLPALSTAKKGGVPATGAPSGKYLKDDGNWSMPTYADVGAAAAGDLTNHINATGTNVHGLGALSTHALGDVHTSNGFANLSDSTLQINGGNFEVALANGKSSFVIYSNGTPITKTTAQQVALSSLVDDNVIYYIYFDSSGVIHASQSPWAIISAAIPAAIIHKSGSAYKVNDERHLAGRNLNWHEWAHETIGCRWETGGGLLLPTAGDPSHLSILGVTIHDEDIENPNKNAQSSCWIMYRTASGTSMKFNSPSSSTPYAISGTNLLYDDGSGTLASASNNSQHVCYWLYATMSTEATGSNLVLVVGQALHNTLAAAQAAPLPSIPLSTAEWKLLYRFIYKNTGATPTFVQADDYRNVVSGPASAGGSAQVSASNVLTTTTLFTNILSAANTTVQSALETFDAAAVSTNTASSLVKRDSSGNFSAGTITAAAVATTQLSVGSTVASAGTIRMPTSWTLQCRNATNNGDITLFNYNSALTIGDFNTGNITIQNSSGSNISLNGGTNVTIGALLVANNKIQTNIIYPATNSETALKLTKADASTAVLTVDTMNSYVGVNCAPSYPLDATSTGGIYRLACSTNATNTSLRFDTKDSGGTARIGYLEFQPATGTNQSYFALSNQAGTQNLIVRSDGNVGIGTTSPAYPLSVENAATNTDYTATFKCLNTTNGQSHGVRILAGVGANDTVFKVGNQANTATYLFVSGTGNVGIGTTDPGVKFEIGTATNTSGNWLRLKSDSGSVNLIPHGSTDSGTNAGISRGLKLYATGSYPLVISHNAAQDMVFGTNDTERMRITSGGLVGIGCAPSYKLHAYVSSSSITSMTESNSITGTECAEVTAKATAGNIGYATIGVKKYTTNRPVGYLGLSDYNNNGMFYIWIANRVVYVTNTANTPSQIGDTVNSTIVGQQS